MPNGNVSRDHVFPPEMIIVKPPICFPPPKPPPPPLPSPDWNTQRQAEHLAREARDRQWQVDRLAQQMREGQRMLDELRRRNEDRERIGRIDREQRLLREQHETLTRLMQRDRERLGELARLMGRRDGQDTDRDEQDPVRSVIDRHTKLFGLNLDEAGLGRELSNVLPSDPALVANVLDKLERLDAIQVAREVADHLADKTLDAVAKTPAGRAALLRLARLLGESDDDDDHRQLQRIAKAASESHTRLLTEPWLDDPAIKKAIAETGVRIQRLAGGTGFHVFDEYTVIADRLPGSTTPEAFLGRLASDLNGTLANPDFDCLNVFERRNEGAPEAGEIVDIDILGPDNGSVMLVALASNHFIYQSVTTRFSQTGEHPEWGAREFGFERNDDGSVTFYTRGVSRQDWWISRGARIGGFVMGGPVGMLLATYGPAALQEKAWLELIRGIGLAIERGGGAVRENGYGAWRTVP